jgi:hypothetical protein
MMTFVNDAAYSRLGLTQMKLVLFNSKTGWKTRCECNFTGRGSLL